MIERYPLGSDGDGGTAHCVDENKAISSCELEVYRWCLPKSGAIRRIDKRGKRRIDPDTGNASGLFFVDVKTTDGTDCSIMVNEEITKL